MTETSTSATPRELFKALRKHLTIAHHVPGRLRVRFSANVLTALPQMDKAQLDTVLGALPDITDVRLNALAGSAVITYLPARIPVASWHTLINADEHDALALLDDMTAHAV